jgi:hypothetical protein
LGHRNQKEVFGTSGPEKIPQKFSLLKLPHSLIVDNTIEAEALPESACLQWVHRCFWLTVKAL